MDVAGKEVRLSRGLPFLSVGRCLVSITPSRSTRTPRFRGLVSAGVLAGFWDPADPFNVVLDVEHAALRSLMSRESHCSPSVIQAEDN